MKGTVQRFGRTRGYGFILADTNEIIFFHFTEWKDYMQVREGDRVEFDVEPNGRGGMVALNVRRERPNGKRSTS